MRSTHEPPPCCLCHLVCTLSENKITNLYKCLQHLSLCRNTVVLSKRGDAGHERGKMFNSNVIILFYYSFIVIIPLHIVGGISGCVDWTWWALPCRRKLWRTHVPVGTDHTAPSTHHNLPCDYKTHRKYFKTARSRAIKHFSQIQIIRYYFNVLPDTYCSLYLCGSENHLLEWTAISHILLFKLEKTATM